MIITRGLGLSGTLETASTIPINVTISVTPSINVTVKKG